MRSRRCPERNVDQSERPECTTAGRAGVARRRWRPLAGALVTHIRRTYYSDQGRPVETADIIVPTALCEIVYEVPVS